MRLLANYLFVENVNAARLERAALAAGQACAQHWRRGAAVQKTPLPFNLATLRQYSRHMLF